MPSEESGRIIPPLEECVYTSCYCEENIWQLCDHVRKSYPHELDNTYAVFISNDVKQVPLFMQKGSGQEDIPVAWDYHVIIVHTSSAGSMVYDMDTMLPFPVSFEDYATKAIGSDEFLYEQFYRFFRVIPAGLFLETLASDRSHMKKDGEWMAAPPDTPCIVAKDGTTNNLDSFISMKKDTGYGEVLNLKDFTSKFMEEGENGS